MTMDGRPVYVCDGIRTPFGRYRGGLAEVRADDLAALPLRRLLERNPALDAAAVDEVVLGCANQAGEDNRNVARMAVLLAGLPVSVPALTVNRLCASGLEAVGQGDFQREADDVTGANPVALDEGSQFGRNPAQLRHGRADGPECREDQEDTDAQASHYHLR